MLGESIEPELQRRMDRMHENKVNAMGCESPVIRIPVESTYIDYISPSVNGCTNGLISQVDRIVHCSNCMREFPLVWICQTKE